MRAMLELIMLMAAQVAIVPSQDAEASDIVVIGNRSEQTKAALERCLADHCPPKEDIAASLAYGEELVVAGDYQSARDALMAARRRNQPFATTLPLDFADLVRANANVASLVGEARVARIGTIDAIDVLRNGLPKGDARVMMQQISAADVFARQGKLDDAEQQYEDVARQAHKKGVASAEGYALLRLASLYSDVAKIHPAYRSAARKAIDRLAATTDPALSRFRDGVPLLRARLDEDAGQKGSIDRAIAKLHLGPTKRPVLLYAPMIDYQPPTPASGQYPPPQGDNQAQWIDVGFRVTAAGAVRDAQVLRRSANCDEDWLKPVMAALVKRRYATLDILPDNPGMLRIERYSLVSDVTFVTGSRLVVRSARPRIEKLDLTADPGTTAS